MKIDRLTLHSFASSLVGPDATVVDLGGNRGEFSERIIERYGCRVVAVEPVPNLYAAFPKRPGLSVVHAAITSEPGPTEIYVNPSQCPSLYIAEPGADVATVQGVTLAELLEAHAISRVDLLKVDIEGAELSMFLTTPDDVLLRCRQISVEFHDFVDSGPNPRVDAVVAHLERLGFQTLVVRRVVDVLFLHPEVRMGGLEYRIAALRYVRVRHFNRWLRLGIARRLRSLADRLAHDIRAAP